MGWGTRGTAAGTAAGGPTVGQHHPNGCVLAGGKAAWGGAGLAWGCGTAGMAGGDTVGGDTATRCSLLCPKQSRGGSSLHTCAHSCNPHHALFCPTHVPPT